VFALAVLADTVRIWPSTKGASARSRGNLDIACTNSLSAVDRSKQGEPRQEHHCQV
jgi:hypothetical protein